MMGEYENQFGGQQPAVASEPDFGAAGRDR